MADYIDRDSLIAHIKKDPVFPVIEQYGITGVIKSFPTENVMPATWISVKEKLPSMAGNYLVATPSQVMEAYYWALDDIWYDPVEGYEDYKDVFYWMPLPEGPKFPPEMREDDEYEMWEYEHEL